MSGVNVRQELEMVARLQHVDTQLLDLELEKGDLPNLVKKLNSDLSEKDTEKQEINERLAEVAKLKRANDGQAQLLKVKQDKYKEQLYSVTTNREYDAINQEIETNKNLLEAIEAEQLKLLEEEDSLNTQLNEIEDATTELDSEREEREGELDSKQQETETEETELQEERDRLTARIKKPIVAHYDRIREARNGTGAAHIYQGACGACFAVIPPQRQAEIRKTKDIILCESCGVILLPEPEYLEFEGEL